MNLAKARSMKTAAREHPARRRKVLRDGLPDKDQLLAMDPYRDGVLDLNLGAGYIVVKAKCEDNGC